MSRLDPEALAWMRLRHQAIATSDLRALGVSRDQQDRMVANGQLRPVLKGGYVAGSAEPDEVMRETALCLAHPELVIAGFSAGRHWGLRFMANDGLVYAIGPPASHPCKQPWVKVYRTALIDPTDIVTLSDGRRVTSPARTVVDLTRYVSPSTLASIIEHVLHLRYCSVKDLQRCAALLDTPGRPWARRFLRVLAGRLPGAPSESGGEFDVLVEFQRQGVRDLVRQFPVTLPVYGPARFDLSIPEIRWAFEADLHPSHWTPEGIARDQARDAAAAKLHWVTRRGGPVRLSKRNRSATIAEAIDDIARRRDEIARLSAVGLWPPPR